MQFSYSVPEFTEPALEHGPVVSFGAVRPEFVGLSEAGWGLATLIGLGYEPDLALSAQQVLDPAETWLEFLEATTAISTTKLRRRTASCSMWLMPKTSGYTMSPILQRPSLYWNRSLAD